MGSHANISVMERSRIIFLRDSGSNISEIARELNMTRNTVRKWIRCYDSEGHVNTRARNVQPRIFTPERLQQLVEVYQQQPFNPTRTFAAQYECTTETVRKALKRVGYNHRRPARKIQLTEAHKAARVRFARDYRDFNFSNAIFSDEKSFTSSQHGRRHLWRLNNTRYEPQNVIPNNESGRIVVNMWGWMSSSGPGELVYIPERANGRNYLELLQETMVPTVRSVYPQDEVPEQTFELQREILDRELLAKVRRYFTPEQLLNLYQAQVRSCMEYCSHLWDGSAKYQLDALESIEKRAKKMMLL